MAIAVIGGLITSTLLSLLVVPAVFTYIDDFEHILRRLMHRMRRQKPAPVKPVTASVPVPAPDLMK
jgi:predicted RND superfamily exporter protein